MTKSKTSIGTSSMSWRSRPWGGAGAVHEDVEPAAPCGRGVDHPLGVLRDGDVAELRHGGAARGGDLLDEGVDATPGLVG